MNRDVNLTKRVHIGGELRYCPVILSANGRVKPDWVVVDGHQERHVEGAYYLDWREGSRRVRKSVGKDASSAAAARFRQEQLLANKAAGIKVVAESGNGTSLVGAVESYLTNIRATRKPKTDVAYRATLVKFLSVCKNRTIEALTLDDLLQFASHLRDVEKLAPRTVNNQFGTVVSFLKASGVQTSGKDGLLRKGDTPKFVEEEPRVYEQEDLDQFFKACDAEERSLFQFFLMTGMREKEVQHCEWSDINFNRASITVRAKPLYGFTPKNFREREIPVPDKLIAELKKRKQKSRSQLVFPSAGGRPDGHLLRRCHAVVNRAGLNTADWWLHKFRATFATTALRGGVDLRTVQDWMGHGDIASTMRYLAPARGQAMRAMVNAMFD